MTDSRPARHPVPLASSWTFVRPSLQFVRQNIDTLLWLVIIPGVLSVLANLLFGHILQQHRAALPNQPTPADIDTFFRQVGYDLTHTSRGHSAVVLFWLSFIWTALTYPASVCLMVRATRKQPTDILSCLRDGFHKFWRIYGAGLFTIIAVGIGLALFVVPGIIAIGRLVFSVFYVADRDMTVMDALKACNQDCKPYAGFVWGTIGVYLTCGVLLPYILNSIPVIGFVFGLAVSYVYYFGFALRYRSISAVSGSKLAAAKK